MMAQPTRWAILGTGKISSNFTAALNLALKSEHVVSTLLLILTYVLISIQVNFPSIITNVQLIPFGAYTLLLLASFEM